MEKLKSLSITTWIFIGMVVGVIIGFIFGESAEKIAFIGTIWMNAMKISIGPIILLMISLAIGKQENMKGFGKVAFQIMFYYVITTIIASCVGIIVTSIMKPGIGFKGFSVEKTDLGSTDLSLTAFLQNTIPNNFISPIANSTMLQCLVLGILVGCVLLTMKNLESKKAIITAFEHLTEMFSGIIRIVMKFAPIGVCCTMAAIIGKYGGIVLQSLGKYILTQYSASILHILIVYCGLVWLIGKQDPIKFLKTMMTPFIIAFTTSSSVLTIPASMEVMKKYDVDPKIYEFTIPLGSQINMDGAAIFFPCVIVFTAQAAGIQLGFITLLTMVIVGSLISSAGGGFYGGALVKLIVMCEMFGVPSDMVAMIASIFAILDTIITVVNIGGDNAGTIIISELDKRRKARAAQNTAAA